MDVYWVVFKLSLLLAGFAFILLALQLYQKYNKKYLLNYLYFLILIYIYAFLNIIGKTFAQNIIGSLNITYNVNTVIGFIFQLLSTPFLILSIYFFIEMLAALNNYKIKLQIRIILSFLLFGILAYIAYNAILNSRNNISKLYSSQENQFIILNTVLFVLVIAVLCFLLIKKPIFESDNKIYMNDQKIFYLLYLIMFSINYLVTDVLEYNCYRFSIVEFFIHLIPIYYLKYLMEKHEDYNKKIVDQVDIDLFIKKHNISKREWDIISLIIDGKSNRIIEEKLFISINTVKSHVYNIYKKTGIKSRWELISLLNRNNNSDLN